MLHFFTSVVQRTAAGRKWLQYLVLIFMLSVFFRMGLLSDFQLQGEM
jgi:hypothetical protein